MPILLIAIILGIVEGVTEFLPVSSTGHLILATELLGFDAEKWAAFNVIIQLGAILAIVVLYWRTFWAVLEGLFKGQAMSWRFVRNILIGFLPSAILGFLLINKIEGLLGNAMVVAVALIVGGIAILVIERLVKNTPNRRDRRNAVGDRDRRRPDPVPVDDPRRQPLGSDDHGRPVAGVERRTAAEFSFFLAIPTHARRDHARAREAPRRADGRSQRGRLRRGRGRVRRQLRRRDRRREGLRPLHLAPRLRALRLVPDRCRGGRSGLA